MSTVQISNTSIIELHLGITGMQEYCESWCSNFLKGSRSKAKKWSQILNWQRLHKIVIIEHLIRSLNASYTYHLSTKTGHTPLVHLLKNWNSLHHCMASNILLQNMHVCGFNNNCTTTLDCSHCIISVCTLYYTMCAVALTSSHNDHPLIAFL